MINNYRVLGLITARGGSKGLPGKNIRNLCGKPLIAWSIDTALQSSYLDRVVVSTDSKEIADISIEYGASVPILRPAELATDTASSYSAIDHMVNFLELSRDFFDIIVLIEPTSPLRESLDIDKALEKMLESNADSIVSVCLAETIHPSFMFKMKKDNRLIATCNTGFQGLRRQELDPIFFPEGTVYASRLETLRAHRSFYQENMVGYIVPKWKSPEVDDIIDFLHIEAIIRHRGIAQ
jgi:CMP-N,N'-diacetyllegionaminic acid synthase